MNQASRFPKWAGQSKHRGGKARKRAARHLSYHRRLLCEALEVRALLSVGLVHGVAEKTGSAAQPQTLADLPAATQHAVSSALGQDQSAYHAAVGAAGVTLANPANRLTAQVQSGALNVSTGADTWDMSLVGLGYGGAVEPLGTAQTSASNNRVDCNYGPVDEWYVNGPAGLEQGFNVTLPAGAAAAAGASLTVELALGGNLTGTVNAAGDGLTLSRPDGSAALGYNGLVAYDATGKALPASLQVEGAAGHQDLLIHVNDAAQGPITIDPWVQEAELFANNGQSGDAFGWSCAISGNTLVVGAPTGDNGQGAAYVFTGSGASWTQVAELTAQGGQQGDWFGISVALSGNTIVVGAPYAPSNANTQAAGPGRGLRVHGARQRLGEHDPDRDVDRTGRPVGRCPGHLGRDQRQYGSGRGTGV